MKTLELDRSGIIDFAREVASGHGRAVLVFGAAALLGLAGLLLARRLSGALAQPLAPGQMLAAMLVLVGAAWAIRMGWRTSRRVPHPSLSTGKAPGTRTLLLDRFMYGGPGVALVGVAIALSVAGTSLAGWVVLWGAVIGSETVAFGLTSVVGRTFANRIGSSQSAPSAMGHGLFEPGEQLELTGEQILLQQLSRVRDADGSETITGTICTPLRPGQRRQNVHVAFCPPFAKTPEVEFFQTGGPRAHLTLAQVQPFGARLDLRLEKASPEPVRVEIEIVAAGVALDDSPAA